MALLMGADGNILGIGLDAYAAKPNLSSMILP